MARRGGAGDGGRTSLLSGERVLKTDARVEACGDLDELSSLLGALIAALPPTEQEVRDGLQAVQSDLLTLGAWTAVSPGSPTADSLRPLEATRVAALEDAIAVWEAALPPLQSFLLPGGHPTAAWAHVARTVCRRAERRVVALDPPPPSGLAYLNRLSSYLFALARWCNHRHGVQDTPWKG